MPARPGRPGILPGGRRLAALLALVALPAVPLAAQTVSEQISAPVSDMAEQYRGVAKTRRIGVEARYSSNPDLMPAPTKAPERRNSDEGSSREPMLEGSWAPALVIALFLMVLLAWLRFGGTGAVLRRAPRELPKQPAAPEGWQIGAQDARLSGKGLLDQLAAMGDRRAALIRLLRHVLLAAARDSNTQFARADTEREAFARLPADLAHRDAVAQILHQVELVHYGGREVSEAAFEQSLVLAQCVLVPGPGGRDA